MEPLFQKYCTPKLDERGVLQKFKLNCPDNFNFAYDVVDVIAKEEPSRTALVWCDVEGNERILSFREMSEYSDRAALMFLSAGIKKGDRVMLMLKRRYEYWYVILALHKIGAIVIPATHMLTAKDIIYRAESADIRAVVCADDDHVIASVRAALPECPNMNKLFCVRKDYEGFERIDHAETMTGTLQRIPNKTSEPFLLYFTSGTTGYPKAVVHDFSYPLAHIITAKYWQNVKDGGLHLTVADTGWGKASWGKIYGQWLAGSAVMVYDYERFHADALMNVIAKYEVTTFCAPPTIYRFLVKNGIENYDLSSLQYATTAGEALSPEIIRKFTELTGITLREGYGQTETVLVIGDLVGEVKKEGSMGLPSPLYDVRIADPEGNIVPPGEIGEIVIVPKSENKRYGLCLGYDNDELASARAWRQGIYHTGDTAYRDEDGYFYFVGRIDDIIKSSGYRIGPFEVESVLIKHPAVLECAITGVPDEERGYIVKATVVLHKDYTASDALAKELQEFVKKATAPYKYPRIVEFVDELPKTISGKIRHEAIRRQDREKNQ